MSVEGPSKNLTLKQKVGYDEVNSEAERRLAGNRSFQTMEAPMEAPMEESAGRCGVPAMEIDKEGKW